MGNRPAPRRAPCDTRNLASDELFEEARLLAEGEARAHINAVGAAGEPMEVVAPAPPLGEPPGDEDGDARVGLIELAPFPETDPSA